jgi:hypothetical protein
MIKKLKVNKNCLPQSDLHAKYYKFNEENEKKNN